MYNNIKNNYCIFAFNSYFKNFINFLHFTYSFFLLINKVFEIAIKGKNTIIVFYVVIQVNKSIDNIFDLNYPVCFNKKGLEEFQISFYIFIIVINIISIYNNINLKTFLGFSIANIKLESASI